MVEGMRPDEAIDEGQGGTLETSVTDYSEPKLTFHGHVDELTLSQSAMFGAQFMAAFATSIIANTPSGEGNSPSVTEGPAPTVTEGPAVTDAPGGDSLDGPGGGVTTLDESAGAGPVDVSDGGSPQAAVTETDSSGGKLPFTGLAASGVAAAGMLAFSAGAALRKITRTSR